MQYRSVEPATGALRAEFDTLTDDGVQEALAAAEAGYRDWAAQPIAERAAVARRVGETFTARCDELARVLTEDMGKPLAEAVEEVEFCAAIFGYYGEHGPRLAAEQPIDTEAGDRAVVQRLPIGVLLGIMPWNFPYYQVARFVAPNLVLGNTMLLKHAESVPRCAEALVDVLRSSGVPAGVYQNLFASHAQVEQLIADPRVQGVSLTGSDRAGSAVAEIAGRNLKKCVLELGGSDPYVVLDAADAEEAAKLAWQTRVYNTGQVCNSNKRIIVSRELFEPFVATMTKLASAMHPGDPLRLENGAYAPMASRAAAERLAAQVEDAVERGARLHAGGELAEAPSAYYAPAVLTDVRPGMRAYDEELFGPVAVVYPVDSDEEALTLANQTVYGLAGAVFSDDPERALRFASGMEVGMANVNTPAGEGAEVPFGGVKRSGFGRELGPLGMDEFVNKRLLYVKAPGGGS